MNWLLFWICVIEGVVFLIGYGLGGYRQRLFVLDCQRHAKECMDEAQQAQLDAQAAQNDAKHDQLEAKRIINETLDIRRQSQNYPFN